MIKYDDTALVTCIDNQQTVKAEILDFKPQVLLSVSFEKSIKLILKYISKSDEYQTELYGRTFVSKGPKAHHVKSSRFDNK
jgi:hypothetical protein